MSKDDFIRLVQTLEKKEIIFTESIFNITKSKEIKRGLKDFLKEELEKRLTSLPDFPESLLSLKTCFELNPELAKQDKFPLCFSSHFYIISTIVSLVPKMDDEKIEELILLRDAYEQNSEEYKEKLKEELKKEKKKWIDFLHNGSIVAGPNYTFKQIQQAKEESIEAAKDARRCASWMIKHMDEVIEVLEQPLPLTFLDYVKQDDLSALLYYITTCHFVNDKEGKEDSEVDLNECDVSFFPYLYYMSIYYKKRKEENPDFNIDFVEKGSNRKAKITDTDLVETTDHFKEKIEGINDKLIKEEDVLKEIFKDYEKELRIKSFQNGLVNWEMITSEKTGMIRGTALKTGETSKISEEERERILDLKLDVFSNLPSIATFNGVNHFEGYVAYFFENGKVLFEKFYERKKTGLRPVVNEAVYVMNVEDFKELSKLSKGEIRSYKNRVKVIYHSKNFKQKILNEVNNTEYNDKVLDYIDNLVSETKKNERIYNK